MSNVIATYLNPFNPGAYSGLSGFYENNKQFTKYKLNNNHINFTSK